jgi:hypothetical protein
MEGRATLRQRVLQHLVNHHGSAILRPWTDSSAGHGASRKWSRRNAGSDWLDGTKRPLRQATAGRRWPFIPLFGEPGRATPTINVLRSPNIIPICTRGAILLKCRSSQQPLGRSGREGCGVLRFDFEPGAGQQSQRQYSRNQPLSVARRQPPRLAGPLHMPHPRRRLNWKPATVGWLVRRPGLNLTNQLKGI